MGGRRSTDSPVDVLDGVVKVWQRSRNVLGAWVAHCLCSLSLSLSLSVARSLSLSRIAFRERETSSETFFFFPTATDISRRRFPLDENSNRPRLKRTRVGRAVGPRGSGLAGEAERLCIKPRWSVNWCRGRRYRAAPPSVHGICPPSEAVEKKKTSEAEGGLETRQHHDEPQVRLSRLHGVSLLACGADNSARKGKAIDTHPSSFFFVFTPSVYKALETGQERECGRVP